MNITSLHTQILEASAAHEMNVWNYKKIIETQITNVWRFLKTNYHLLICWHGGEGKFKTYWTKVKSFIKNVLLQKVSLYLCVGN